MSQVVHVWRLPLAANSTIYARMWPQLSNAERNTAAQFVSEIDRHRFVLSHGAMREILAHEAGCVLDELHIAYAAKGKPFLQAPFERLQFSLSHSEDLALLAVCHDMAVGIDVEYQKPLQDLACLIEQVSGPAERRIVAASSATECTFYRCWVGKEALLKCIGSGLNQPLHEFNVLDAQGNLVAWPKLPHDHEVRINLRQLEELPSDFLGAIAVQCKVGQESDCLHIEMQDWEH